MALNPNSGSSSNVTLETGDLQIGAVELKDATSTTRATIGTLGSVGALYVASVDSSGNIISSGDSNITQIAGNSVVTGGVNGLLAVGGSINHDYPDTGNPLKIGGKAYTGTPATVANSDRVDAWFDEYGRLGIKDQAVYNASTGGNKVEEVNPVDEHYLETELADTTNVAAATNYYPDSDGLSMSGNIGLTIGIVTSGGVTFTVEGTNDDAGTPDWQDITLNFVDVVTGIPATGYVDQSAMLIGNCPFKTVRVKSITSDATNAVQYHIKRTPYPIPNTVAKTAAGADLYFDSDGDNTAQALKASAGRLYKLHVINENAADAYVQLFNVAAGSVTVGTTTPNYVIFVPANGAVIEDFDPSGNFNTAITYACTTTATGSGDPTTGLTVSGLYK